ncbi:MAG: rhodanese-like domain-containing protein [Chloroflexota bacterium]
MLLRRFYHDGLAQASYMVGCQASHEAIIIDPNRRVEQYIEAAYKEGLRITGVTETHIHADFVSGARELAQRTGAHLYLSDEGPSDWKYAFATSAGATMLHDGDTIQVGGVRLQVVHTPGHTPEHISFLLTDTRSSDRPMGMFTGDFVFVGDVGRPDLLERAAGIKGTMESGARSLYASLQRFKELPDYLQVWPAHGAGSACGRALGAVPQSTTGYEKLTNWALQVSSEEEFVQEVLRGQPEPPPYFAHMKRINKEGPGPPPQHRVPMQVPCDLRLRLAGRMTIVDVRRAAQYAAGHLPGTINIPRGGDFLIWAGWLLPYDKPLGLIVNDEELAAVTAELQMIGLDNVSAFWPPSALKASLPSKSTRPEHQCGRFKRQSASDLQALIEKHDLVLLDVRTAEEHGAGHIPGSRNVPLAHLEEHIREIPRREQVVVYCAAGSRSPIAASILQGHGWENVVEMYDGFDAWQRGGYPVEK